MAGNLGSLVISLGLNAVEFVTGLTKAEYQTRQAMRSIQQEVERTRAVFEKVTSTFAVLSGGALSLSGIIAEVHALAEATIKSEDSINQLNAVLLATGSSAGKTVDDLDKLGKSIKEATTFSDIDIRNAETALLRFRDIRGETFDRALGQLPDLAVVLNTTLPEAATKLGRAIEDLQGGSTRGLRGLKEAGVNLSPLLLLTAENMAKTGDAAGATKIVLDQLTASTSGAAQAATLGLSGATKKLERAFEELQVAAGKKLFGDNHEVLSTIATAFEELTKKINESTTSVTTFFTKLALVASSPIAAGLAAGGAAGIAVAEKVKGLYEEYVKGIPKSPPASEFGTGPFKEGGGAQLTEAEDKARADSLKAKLEQQFNTATLLQLKAYKEFASKSAQFYAGDLATQRDYFQAKQTNLTFAYHQGEISTEDYFAALNKAETDSFAAFEKIQAKRIQINEAITTSTSQHFSPEDKLAAEARILGIVNESTSARYALHQKLLEQQNAEIVALQKLGDEYANLRADALEASGELGQAATLRFETAERIRRKELETRAASPNPLIAIPAQQAVDDLNLKAKQLRAQADLNKAARDYQFTTQGLAIDLGKIDLLQQTGALTEINAINKRSELAQKYIGQLQEQLALEEQAAKALTGPEKTKALLDIETLRLEIDKLAASSDVLAKKFNDIFIGAISDGIVALVDRTKTLKQVITDIGKSIETQITKIAADQITGSLFAKGGAFGDVGGFFAGIFGGKPATTGKEESGSFLDKLFLGLQGKSPASQITADTTLAKLSLSAGTSSIAINTMATAAGQAAIALASVSGAGASSAFTSAFGQGNPDLGGLLGLFGDVPLAAGGGSFPAGRPVIVGERGPELFVPKSAGTVIPANILAGRRAQKNVTIGAINITVPGNTSRATADQIALKIVTETNRSARRNG